MEKKPTWIKPVYARKPATERHDRPRAVTSPYDVPEAFRIAEMPGERVVIEFRYIDHHESGQTLHLSGDVKVSIGRATKRLLAVEFKPADHDADELVARLNMIIRQLSKRGDLHQQAEWNYKAVRDAVDGSIGRFRDAVSSFFLAAHAH